jgi:anti-sigma factor RsiW
MIRWKMVERIGAYVAGELSGEEAHRVERLILEDPNALELAESYARLLAFLSAVGRESPVPPPAIVENAVRWAANDIRAIRACEPHEPGAGEGCSTSRTRRYKKGRPKNEG